MIGPELEVKIIDFKEATAVECLFPKVALLWGNAINGTSFLNFELLGTGAASNP